MHELPKFAMERLDACLAEANKLLELQAELFGPS
jgi:hypothetical protein